MSGIFEQTIQILATAGIESPRLEARLMLAAACGCTAAEIFSDITLKAPQKRLLNSLIKQRLQHKPLDKILGHRAFYKSDFAVSEDVLSPRPDTEILVEEALNLISDKAVNILDLGTGSGCIIESILLENKSAHGTAVDISAASLQIAERNAVNLKVANRLEFIQADWFDADFMQHFTATFDLIVSNPPYIPTADIALLAPEVKDHDPLYALDGGSDGLSSYRRIAEIAPMLLNSHGYVLLEAGINQAQPIVDIFQNAGFKHCNTVADLGGIERCIVMRR